MTPHNSSSSSARSKILAHLRTLRGNLAQARSALMHFKEDRVDRDKLEPAARRADDLMNMFASDTRDASKGTAWVTEIQSGVDQIANPKAADALRDARVEITALLSLMAAGGSGAV